MHTFHGQVSGIADDGDIVLEVFDVHTKQIDMRSFSETLPTFGCLAEPIRYTLDKFPAK